MTLEGPEDCSQQFVPNKQIQHHTLPNKVGCFERSHILMESHFISGTSKHILPEQHLSCHDKQNLVTVPSLPSIIPVMLGRKLAVASPHIMDHVCSRQLGKAGPSTATTRVWLSCSPRRPQPPPSSGASDIALTSLGSFTCETGCKQPSLGRFFSLIKEKPTLEGDTELGSF